MAPRAFAPIALVVLVAVAGLWFVYSGPRRAPLPSPTPSPTLSGAPAAPVPGRLQPPPLPAPPPPAPVAATPPPGGCEAEPAFAEAARLNGETLRSRVAAPMGREEIGWEIYAPLAAHEIGTPCAPDTPGFAAALAGWQQARRLAASGTMEPATLEALRLVWHARRPFVAATRHGECPAAPDPATLAPARPDEGYSGKLVSLRPTALTAWRQMVAAARAEDPAIATDRRLLTIFSAFRGPEDEAGRCADGGCSTPARATCSAHRTGLAVDLYLGEAPGLRPESSADPNRLFQTRTAAYRWLVANAARFGFAPYAFEPWHWEWTGEAT